jgi:hypothetical protein
MINLTSPRLIVKQLKANGRPSPAEILLVEFILPGKLNKIAS